jgi:hypothetical protein
VKWLPDDEVEMLIGEHFLVDDAANLDWTLRHGRSTGLFVALKLAAERVYDVSDDRKRRVVAVLKSHLSADRVPIAQNGVRSCGYLFQHLIAKVNSLKILF